MGCTRPKERRAPAAEASASPSTVAARTEGGRTRLEIQTAADSPLVLVVDRDSTVAPDAEPSDARVVGEVHGAVVVVDTYPSIPGGMSFCQAGEERFLRAVALAAPQPAETYRVKVASCRDNVELGSTGIEWQPDLATVRIHWLAGPGGSRAAETRMLRIGRDGRIQQSAP